MIYQTLLLVKGFTNFAQSFLKGLDIEQIMSVIE